MVSVLRDQKFYPLSVVIATLGGDCLAETIRRLNAGTAIPAEILICIPEKEAPRVEGLPFPNVVVLKTPCRGQVAQRAYGLRQVHQPMALQMDDDIELSPGALDELIQALERAGKGNAIAPVYRHLDTKAYITRYRAGMAGWIDSMSASLLCGAPWGTRRMGVISPAGIGYGVDANYCGAQLFETQWLPGGCVICYRDDLVTEDYYPFSGKAFTEDLVHSVLWRKQGVRLWVLPTASCLTTVAVMPFSWSAMRDVMRAHECVASLINGQKWRLRIWYAAHALKVATLAVMRRLLPS